MPHKWVCACVFVPHHTTRATSISKRLLLIINYACDYYTVRIWRKWLKTGCARCDHTVIRRPFFHFFCFLFMTCSHTCWFRHLEAFENLSAGVNYANWKCQHEWHALSGGKNIAEMNETDDGDDKVNKPRRNGMDRVFADLELQQVLCKIVVILATSCLNLCW